MQMGTSLLLFTLCYEQKVNRQFAVNSENGLHDVQEAPQRSLAVFRPPSHEDLAKRWQVYKGTLKGGNGPSLASDRLYIVHQVDQESFRCIAPQLSINDGVTISFHNCGLGTT